MVGLYLYHPGVFANLHSLGAEKTSFGEFVDVAQEAPGVECERIGALLEFVEFFDYGYRDHQVVLLEFVDGFVVVQDDVRV